MRPDNTVSQQKTKYRKILKTVRANIPEMERMKHANSITEQVLNLDEIRDAGIIFIYISCATEVHTHHLIKNLLATGKILTVPKIVNSEYMQTEFFSSWEDLVPGKLGILTPASTRTCNESPDVAIVPGLGFSFSGHRLGFGQGCYDKWFAKNKVKHKIALAYEAQLVDKIPFEETDVLMDKIITEQRIIVI